MKVSDMPKKMTFKTVPLSDVFSGEVTLHEDPPKHLVLVVDDEVVIADTLTAILSQSGMATLTAYDAETALKIARTIPPNLLLTDVMMPGMNGIDLAIAMGKCVPDCKVLLFSGQAGSVDMLTMRREAGGNFTLIGKPIHPKELLVRISESLKAQASKPPELSAVYRGGHQSARQPAG